MKPTYKHILIERSSVTFIYRKQTTELYIGLTKKMLPILRNSDRISKDVVDRFEVFIPTAGKGNEAFC
jgi:hypothetical protein